MRRFTAGYALRISHQNVWAFYRRRGFRFKAITGYRTAGCLVAARLDPDGAGLMVAQLAAVNLDAQHLTALGDPVAFNQHAFFLRRPTIAVQTAPNPSRQKPGGVIYFDFFPQKGPLGEMLAD